MPYDTGKIGKYPDAGIIWQSSLIFFIVTVRTAAPSHWGGKQDLRSGFIIPSPDAPCKPPFKIIGILSSGVDNPKAESYNNYKKENRCVRKVSARAENPESRGRWKHDVNAGAQWAYKGGLNRVRDTQ